MAPDVLGSSSLILSEATYNSLTYKGKDGTEKELKLSKSSDDASNENIQKNTYTWDIRWINVLAFVYLHLGTLYGLYVSFFIAKWVTFPFAFIYACFTGIGITGGAHRLWAHRAYSAKWPLRVILCICQTAAFQNHIYEWARDHRVHHKFSETDADPHNAKRGFFFSHIGWLMVRKHSDVKLKGKTVDMSDLERDPIVMFQKKYYLYMMPFFSFILPTLIPWYFFNETLHNSWYVAGVTRFTFSLNATWLVNSAAHIWGKREYDRSIGAANNTMVAWCALGEGWHNYHHIFPWDYKAGELGSYKANWTTAIIDLFSRIGWAFDLKTVPQKIIEKRALRTGDGSHPICKEHSHEGEFWGWGDTDMTENDKNCAEIVTNKED